MSVQKERKIKKLKKKSFWPSIILLFFFMMIFMAIIVVFVNMFIMGLFYTKVGQTYDETKNMAEFINIQMQKNPNDLEEVNTLIADTVNKSVELCVIDTNQNFVLHYGADTPVLENKAEFELDRSYSIYFDDVSGMELDEKEQQLSIDIPQILRSVVKGSPDVETGDEEEWLDQVVVSFQYWMEQPIGETEYHVLLRHTLTFERKEIFYVFAVAVLFLILGTIPMILLLINTIGGIITQQRMSRLYYLDPVTGGQNWLYFQVRSEKLLKHHKRKNEKRYALIALSMDRYRGYTSCYGTVESEELLEAFDTELKRRLEKKEAFARYADAEFGMLLQYDDFSKLEERILILVAALKSIRGNQKYNFCVGIYKIEDRKLDVGTMYSYASEAKKLLHNDSIDEIGLFSEEMLAEQLWERKVENSMEQALRDHEFQVYLQPKYSTVEQKISGAEALVRWISPSEGFVSPGRFIPIFEKNGFVTHLDDYMLTEVAKQQAKWLKEGKEVVTISVNVSRAHFTREDLAEHICRLVDPFEVPHHLIELELTESAFFDDKEILLETVRRLQDYGFLISMDDFGSGYSSLNSLKDLPLDVLKLDAEFFRGEGVEKRGEIVVSEAIRLAKNLEMKIVAEGIETKDQVDFLAGQGCDLIQGFYFAKPMPLSQFEEEAFGGSALQG